MMGIVEMKENRRRRIFALKSKYLIHFPDKIYTIDMLNIIQL